MVQSERIGYLSFVGGRDVGGQLATTLADTNKRHILEREGYLPDWLLERRRRAEQATISAAATSYLLGVSTRRVKRLVDPTVIVHDLVATGVNADGRREILGRVQGPAAPTTAGPSKRR